MPYQHYGDRANTSLPVRLDFSGIWTHATEKELKNDPEGRQKP